MLINHIIQLIVAESVVFHDFVMRFDFIEMHCARNLFGLLFGVEKGFDFSTNYCFSYF